MFPRSCLLTLTCPANQITTTGHYHAKPPVCFFLRRIHLSCQWYCALIDHNWAMEKPCLFRVYRGLYSPVMWAYKNHYKYKDHYLTTDMLESKWGCFFVVQFCFTRRQTNDMPLWGAFDQCFWKLGVSLSSSSTNHSIKCHDGYG